jgi:hypothetical protein
VPPFSAQLASEIAAVHRSGQTFVTWREAAQSGVIYRVYRATSPLASYADLAFAERLGEVDDKSSHNTERSLVEHGERTWVIAPGGAPLAVDQGLFVYTVESDAPAAYYAVTAVRGGVEGSGLTSGWNATELPLTELCAPPEPVLQAVTSTRETWSHWVGNRATPFQPALSLTPSHGFDFCFEYGKALGPRGLLLRLHAAGGTYAQGWPPRGIVPADTDVLALSDLHSITHYTFWFGAHERFPFAPLPDTHVWSYTEDRVQWTLEWARAHLGAGLDPERVSVAGSSLGAIGGMYLVEEHPELFSAALLRNGNYDLAAGDLADTSVFEKLYGPFALDLPMRSGQPVLARTNARTMALLAPGADWPMIRTINGRQDTRVGWASAVTLYTGLAETWRPSADYFDNRTHSPKGYWSTLERALVKRTCAARRDRPLLCFSACSCDDDPGDGARTSGDTVGTIGGRVDFDALHATASALELDYSVYLRAEGALDDAGVATGFAVLTPRRTGAFAPAPGEVVHFTLSSGSTLVDEHWLTADELGLVHTPPVPLSLTPRTARFVREELGACHSRGGLVLGRAPLPGDELQALVNGRAGESFELVLLPGGEHGPLAGPAESCSTRVTGRCDARGRADVRVELGAAVPAGTWLWGRARVGGAWSPWSTAIVQSGRGPLANGLLTDAANPVFGAARVLR